METIDDIHLKGWGYEKWIVNSDKYCGNYYTFMRVRGALGTTIR